MIRAVFMSIDNFTVQESRVLLRLNLNKLKVVFGLANAKCKQRRLHPVNVSCSTCDATSTLEQARKKENGSPMR